METRKQTPKQMLLLQSSPHIASPVSTKTLMRNMLIALLPLTVFAVEIFGLNALLNIVVAVVSALAAEYLFRLITKQQNRSFGELRDLSAVVTGLLLAMVIPPGTPLWMTALGSVFAIVVAKEFFGGLGGNVFNPALAGRAFLLMSFPAALTTWHKPASLIRYIFTGPALTPDVLTTATPLGITKISADISEIGFGGYWDTMLTMFFGYRAGSMGEVSIFLILAAFLFLLVTKTIDWRAPVSMIITGFIAALALWQSPSYALYSILAGGFMFGAVFMVTDPVTAPVTELGKILFGCGVGIIAMLIRRFGLYPEGVCFAILIMNAAVRFLNQLISKKYGYVKPKKEKPVAADTIRGKETSK